MNEGHSSCNALRGHRLLSAALALVVTMCLAAHAAAQRIGTTPGGIGGGAGVMAPLPPMTPAITPPVMAPPVAVPAPPVVVPAPASPPSVTAPSVPAPATPAPATLPGSVRFHCELAPQAQSCRDPGTAPDGGGGDDAECNCARDTCSDRIDMQRGMWIRVCEKR